jgi:hypothetical protein
MFSKIIGNIKSSKEELIKEKLLEKISKMDLADMRIYVNGKFTEYKVSEYGLLQILKKINIENENTSHLYLKHDDMDSKKKKVFDLILLILSSKYISVKVIDSVQAFLKIYIDIIKKYDIDNRQIYETKIKESIGFAADKVSFKSDIENKMRTLN